MQIEVSGISIELIRKNVKNINLTVTAPDGKVRVSAPWDQSEAAIRSFINSKLGWIREKQAAMLSKPQPVEKQYLTGETLWIFGTPYCLQVVTGPEYKIKLTSEGLAVLSVLPGSTVQQREHLVKEFYRQLLKKAIAQYLPRWEQTTGLYSSCWQIRDMKTRWGTCNTNTRKIWLNLQLAQKPPECLEYVILHELAHLRVGNHSKDFYAVLDKYMPDWSARRQLLNRSQVQDSSR